MRVASRSRAPTPSFNRCFQRRVTNATKSMVAISGKDGQGFGFRESGSYRRRGFCGTRLIRAFLHHGPYSQTFDAVTRIHVVSRVMALEQQDFMRGRRFWEFKRGLRHKAMTHAAPFWVHEGHQESDLPALQFVHHGFVLLGHSCPNLQLPGRQRKYTDRSQTQLMVDQKEKETKDIGNSVRKWLLKVCRPRNAACSLHICEALSSPCRPSGSPGPFTCFGHPLFRNHCADEQVHFGCRTHTP